jgi:hypothetical protein
VTKPVSTPQPPSTACQEALVAIADGRLADWRGSDGCTRADADHVFGATGAPDVPGVFGASQTYPARAAAPHGVAVWAPHGRDDITAVLIALPRPVAPLEELLGPPETTLRSDPGFEQRIWASRGLVAYVQPDGLLLRVLGLRRMTTDEFLASPFAHVFDGNPEVTP